MGDHHDRPALALLLEALVATALIGTFFVYGYPDHSWPCRRFRRSRQAGDARARAAFDLTFSQRCIAE